MPLSPRTGLVVQAGRTTVESLQLYEVRREEVIVSTKMDSRRVVDLEQIGQVTVLELGERHPRQRVLI